MSCTNSDFLQQQYYMGHIKLLHQQLLSFPRSCQSGNELWVVGVNIIQVSLLLSVSIIAGAAHNWVGWSGHLIN